MAQVVLSAAGQAIGGPVGGVLGSALGSMVDQRVIDSLKPARQIGPRLEGLRLTATAEGAPMAAVFGRARVSGQMIWAARFRERREEGRTGGGKGGQRTIDYRYSLSFAVGLCEGPIDGIGRVWADGAPMDMTGVTMRVYRGTPDQTPDPLIEAVEGEAPAYRGTAYVVFEDLALDAYGDRPPQLSFEVFRRPEGDAPGLEERLTGVCLIPGAGEFVYATEAVLRREGIARYVAENVNTGGGLPDLTVSLDQLQAALPNLQRVSLVVAWFGDDLRGGACQVRPGVESMGKATTPWSWQAGGVEREGARLISGGPEAPAFGGTPADRSVLQAIAELKARGLEVTLYPLLMMDVPEGNGLPDPYGADEQAAFPWRGRITCDPAPGQPASVDGSAAAAEQAAAFFGAAQPEDFEVADELPSYTGPEEWSFRRMVLHYAKLAELAGGVDGFLIGSELRGLTALRDGDGGYPVVDQFRTLATDVRTILGEETAVSYGADWSEWFGHQPADGSGDLRFHLDPLWADPAISYVGIDWYPPLTDWRSGGGGLDAVDWGGPHDRGYLMSGVAGGEGFAWFYASAEARETQVRTPITDGAYGEPWVFRPKDLVSWWSHVHHERVAGVRLETPTSWTPGMKPIRFTEFGCPAVDRGANSPNLFVDGRSSESALPIDSDGSRDEVGQRRALEATLAWFGETANNPVSDAYGGPMLADADAWCWDARPFPAFPAREKVWADAPNWATGHWLNGRAGGGDAAAMIAAVLRRSGLAPENYDVTTVSGSVAGLVIDRPMRVRDALEPLMLAFGCDGCERDGKIAFVASDGRGADKLTLTDAELATVDDDPDPQGGRVLEPAPDAVRVTFVDSAGDYQTAAVTVRAETPAGGGVRDLTLPLVTERGTAEAIARSALIDGRRESAIASLAPEAALWLEPGDLVELEAAPGSWRVAELQMGETARAMLARPRPSIERPGAAPDWRVDDAHRPSGPPAMYVLDPPPLPGRENDARPLIAAVVEPWRALDIWSGGSPDALTPRATVTEPAVLGETLTELRPGPLWRWDRSTIVDVRMQAGALQSRGADPVAEGRNVLLVRAPSGDWEALSFQTAVLIGPETWRLSTLLRGRWGTEGVMTMTPAGAPVVLIDDRLTRAEVAADERGLERLWRAAPAGGPAAGAGSADVVFDWEGEALRPWAAAHLRVQETPDGGRSATWLRRARVGGDGWVGEPPLGEAAERWRVRVLDPTDAIVRETEVASGAWLYAPDDLADDFGGPPPEGCRFEVAQFSAAFGWGAPAFAPLI